MDEISATDQKYLWHPLTQHYHVVQHPVIAKAQGVYLYDVQGKRYIDAISSWYTCVYGHCHPRLAQAVRVQAETLDQVVFTGFTHEPATQLATALFSILPPNQRKAFFSDNGSTAVEVALKMSLQYFYNQGESRDTLLAFENGFHGDTFGAMSTSGLSVYNGPFERFFLKVERIPIPTGENTAAILATLERLIARNRIAAFIYEPLVQGAAGMQMMDAKGLDAILRFLRERDILLVADEVMTGFGKTGAHFASDSIPTQPDIICLAKALTGGMVPMGLTTCTEAVYAAFLSENPAKGFFHGHTYSANPIACAVARAAIELLKSREVEAGRAWIERQHSRLAAEIQTHPKIAGVRHSGVILAFDLRGDAPRYGRLRNAIYNYFMARGVYLRPLGHTVYILPPYTISEAELTRIYRVIKGFLSSL